ncbi:hypothetical protein E2562_004607 [Oryza meyeriana var. granulata]|uniref:Uncharacterized protein n=1 Tax=Oryza meyeriana var. granulata TaxID=110450 RepID=A0A6G1F3T2_9ORYZ|nr:hypothetical protein E2562_004607 [Oryza meyeriana var. granulata]
MAVPHRRSANYQPNTWDYDSICSDLQQHYSVHANKVQKPSEEISWVQVQARLKDRVRQQLLVKEEEDMPAASRLRLIDQLQSLGVAYHFEEEIKNILISISSSTHHQLKLKNDLSSTALLFRMLRGHGLPASAGDDDNKKDVDGLISLYEASYLAFPGETMLDEARAFAMESLKESSERIDGVLSGLPLHWRAPRLQALWSLKQQHEHGDDMIVRQLAAADFNLVQCVHGGELERMTRWWKETGVGEKKLPFARDRVVECFFCAACIAPEPRLEACRQVLTKVSSLIIVLDDIYDVYGTLHELQAFTHAIGRWDKSSKDDVLAAAVEGGEELPEYMKAMYSAIVATSVSAADAVIQRHSSLLPLYKKAWHELCKAFLVEATWQQRGYRPGLEEYLNNAWITSTGPLLLLHAFPTLNHQQWQQQQQLVDINNGGNIVYPKLIELSSRIFRLCNDSATHKAESERGDAPSAIACCMMEKGATEEQARGDVRDAIAETWKELNREVASLVGAEEKTMSMCSLNLARTIHCIYHDGDAITDPTDTRKQLIKDMLFTPCHLHTS